MVNIHHACICTNQFEAYCKLFAELGMNEQKRRGEEGSREIWFHEGIQLKEVGEVTLGNGVHHIALFTDNKEETLRTAFANGCRRHETKEHWFYLPNGVAVELMVE